MKKQPKLTPWFPASINPARAGSYEVGFISNGEVCEFPFRYHYFTGAGWMSRAASEPEVVSGRTTTLEELYGDDRQVWRGLAVKL